MRAKTKRVKMASEKRLLLKLRISGGSEFCFKIYVEREICVKEGAGWVGRMRAGG